MPACECCRRRKIRCDGENPCKKCEAKNLPCFYATPRKRGPKGGRKSVILELQKPVPVAASAPPVSLPAAGATTATANAPPGATSRRSTCSADESDDSKRSVFSEPKKPPFESYSWETFDRTVLTQLIGEYFANLHVITPVLDHATLLRYLEEPARQERYAVVLGVCFAALIARNAPAASDALSRQLLREMERAHNAGGDYNSNVNVDAVMSAYLLSSAHFRIEQVWRSWFYIRQAITLGQLLGIDRESYYIGLDPHTARAHKMLFFTLYVSERGISLHSGYPLTLKMTIAYPVLPPQDVAVYGGIVQMAKLFSYVDEIRAMHERAGIEDGFRLLSELERTKISATFDIHKADFYISNLWFRLRLLSGSSSPPDLITRVSASILLDIENIDQQLSRSSIAIHGQGIIMKLYDIVSALAEFHGISSIIPHALTGTPEERVSQLLDIIATFRQEVPHLTESPPVTSIPQDMSFYEAVSTDDIYRVLGTLYDVSKFVNPSNLLMYGDPRG